MGKLVRISTAFLLVSERGRVKTKPEVQSARLLHAPCRSTTSIGGKSRYEGRGSEFAVQLCLVGRPLMKKAKYLTRDYRMVEPKKPGQPKACPDTNLPLLCEVIAASANIMATMPGPQEDAFPQALILAGMFTVAGTSPSVFTVYFSVPCSAVQNCVIRRQTISNC